eukprot:COSAG06_NODE_6831_length_2753_cov_6.636045_4_plen_264_part_00
MYSSFRDEREAEQEPEPENWSAHLIIAAKGGAVELEEERDEWGAVVQDAERLTGLALAKRCRAEGADLAYTGAELGSGEEDGEEADGGALTALGWASSFKNIPVMEYLQLEDATERLIDACREGDLARATQARMDGADLLAVGELETGQENWCPLLELAQRWNNYDVEAFLEQEFKGAALELIIAAKEADSKRAFLARRAVRTPRRASLADCAPSTAHRVANSGAWCCWLTWLGRRRMRTSSTSTGSTATHLYCGRHEKAAPS